LNYWIVKLSLHGSSHQRRWRQVHKPDGSKSRLTEFYAPPCMCVMVQSI